jgi:hypothetical protein
MPWEPFIKYGTHRATSERVVIDERNEEEGKVRFRRQPRIMRTGTAPRPDVPREEADADEIELDDDR